MSTRETFPYETHRRVCLQHLMDLTGTDTADGREILLCPYGHVARGWHVMNRFGHITDTVRHVDERIDSGPCKQGHRAKWLRQGADRKVYCQLCEQQKKKELERERREADAGCRSGRGEGLRVHRVLRPHRHHQR